MRAAFYTALDRGLWVVSFAGEALGEQEVGESLQGTSEDVVMPGCELMFASRRR
jgi:hypothetical protein